VLARRNVGARGLLNLKKNFNHQQKTNRKKISASADLRSGTGWKDAVSTVINVTTEQQHNPGEELAWAGFTITTCRWKVAWRLELEQQYNTVRFGAGITKMVVKLCEHISAVCWAYVGCV
jgi:hypothetical protein